ncbi:MAG: hypothetical protein AB7E52_00940 [Bdellovibrionales bacterium]
MDFIDALETLDPNTRKEVFEVMERIAPNSTDVELQEKVFFNLLGVVALKREFDNYANTNPGADPLGEAQHPKNAHFGPSNPSGAKKFVTDKYSVGEYLVVRAPNAVFYETDGTRSADAKTFVPLVQSKHIGEFTHVKGSASRAFHLAYVYYKAGCLYGMEPPKKEFEGINPLDIRFKDACNYALLAQSAAGKHRSYYTGMGLNFDGLNDEAATTLMMAAEDVMREEKLYLASKDALTLKMLPGVCDEYGGRRYVYVNETKEFVAIPSQEGTDAENEAAIDAFRQRLPGYEPGKKDHFTNPWQKKVLGLVQGYQTYLDERAITQQLAQPDRKLAADDFCADSRTDTRVFSGPVNARQSTMRRVKRAAGNPYFDENGELTLSAQRFLAYAKEDDVIVGHSGHGNCGAAGLAFLSCKGDNDGVPPEFQIYAKSNQVAFDAVMRAGNNQREIMAHYSEKTGVPLNSLVDCLAIEVVEQDADRIRSIPAMPRLLKIYQSTGTTDIYVENVNNVPGENPYIKLPYIKGLEAIAYPDYAQVAAPRHPSSSPKMVDSGAGLNGGPL